MFHKTMLLGAISLFAAQVVAAAHTRADSSPAQWVLTPDTIDLTTATGSMTPAVAVQGTNIDEEGLARVARGIRLETWPERVRVSATTIVEHQEAPRPLDVPIPKRDVNAQPVPVAGPPQITDRPTVGTWNLVTRPTAALADRWHVLVVPALPQGFVWPVSGLARVGAAGEHEIRFRPGSAAQVSWIELCGVGERQAGALVLTEVVPSIDLDATNLLFVNPDSCRKSVRATGANQTQHKPEPNASARQPGTKFSPFSCELASGQALGLRQASANRALPLLRVPAISLDLTRSTPNGPDCVVWRPADIDVK
jgi:hypothetical protein